MKLVTFSTQGSAGPLYRLGLLLDDRVADLNGCTRDRLENEVTPEEAETVAGDLTPADLLAFLRRGDEAMAAARETLRYLEDGGEVAEDCIFPTVSVRLHAPLRRPYAIRDFIAFEQHIRTSYAKLGLEVNPIWYELPVYNGGQPEDAPC